MKTAINLPSEKDFFSCRRLIIDEMQFRYNTPRTEKEVIQYARTEVPFRHVIDYSEYTAKIDVLDEKQLEAIKEVHEGLKKIQPIGNPAVGAPIIGTDENHFDHDFAVQPHLQEPPMRTISLQVTFIQYFSGVARMIMTPFDEFDKAYKNWLKLERLGVHQ